MPGGRCIGWGGHKGEEARIGGWFEKLVEKSKSDV